MFRGKGGILFVMYLFVVIILLGKRKIVGFDSFFFVVLKVIFSVNECFNI